MITIYTVDPANQIHRHEYATQDEAYAAWDRFESRGIDVFSEAPAAWASKQAYDYMLYVAPAERAQALKFEGKPALW